MIALSERRAPGARIAATSGIHLVLRYARNVHAAVDRRTPEAGALATWFAESAASFGLPGAVADDTDESFAAPRRRSATAPTWRKIGSALTVLPASLTAAADAPSGLWVAAISTALGLDDVSADILALALAYRIDQRVDRLFDALSGCRGGPPTFHRDAVLIALLLGTSPAEVATRMTNQATLLASGLLEVDRHSRSLNVLERLLSLVRRDVPPGSDLYGQLLGATDPAPLTWECFSHIGREAEVAARVLRAALDGRERGINLLLYGPPGTGKTSFAATLAARVGVRLRAVGEADEVGDEPHRQERLSELRLAQRLAPAGSALLLFDEAEDLFVRSGRSVDDEPATGSRVFMHRLLEQVAVPVIWTANDIGVLGPAVLRRMTMCLELRVPDLRTRAVLWRRMGESEGVTLRDGDAALLARLVPAAPAVAAAALRATRLAGGGADTTRLIVEGVTRAVEGGTLRAPEPEPDRAYDPALANADHDLDRLVADVTRPSAPRAVSFLLSGPPGAGKSAWVCHLAGRMGLPVLQKRASDLLDSFVGGTEQNIARAFAEARDARAFLVFDEADGLLLDRASATHSWEITQVNEMLTWMENHPLPFACTTNLHERFDRASLRRFLVKVRFDWLSAAQARLAFQRVFGLAPPDGLDTLRTLAPADFDLVRRRAGLHGDLNEPRALLRLLAAECEGRNERRRIIGFGR